MNIRSTKAYVIANYPFWFELGTSDKEFSFNTVKLIQLNLNHIPEKQVTKVTADTLSEIGFKGYKKNKYLLFRDNNVTIIKEDAGGFFKTSKSIQLMMSAYADSIALHFRNQTKIKLLNMLANQGNQNSIDKVLIAFQRYTFFDGYSIWLYNNKTQYFTRIDGNLVPVSNFVERSKYELLSSAVEKEDLLSGEACQADKAPDVTEKMKWVNVFSVTLTPSESELSIIAVICMYSVHHGYNLRNDTYKLIKSFYKQSLAHRYLDRIFHLNNASTKLSNMLNIDKITDFLDATAKFVAEELHWETCSVLLVDPSDPSSLRLASIWPIPKNISVLKEKPYPISKTSLTSQVFKTNESLWSYDIKNDPRNSHTIDDPTETEARDWIGVPLATHKSNPIGVLRVKNRKPLLTDEIPYFCNLDMYNLKAIASEVSSALHQYDIFSEKEKLAEKRRHELQNMEDFLRTFRHEMRSPTQALCFAPQRIKWLLHDEFGLEEQNLPKKLREYLSDFEATANRLEMISKSFTLAPEEMVNDICTNHIFKDCIAPVLAFCTPYAQKKNKFINVDKDSLSYKMKCDAIAISIAFHCLLDNAIKYSDSKSIIEVYGKKTVNGLNITVINRTQLFPITDDLVTLEQKYVRGSTAKEQKLEGSGIGLFLASKIMILHKGRLVLSKNKTPIKFILYLPEHEIRNDLK